MSLRISAFAFLCSVSLPAQVVDVQGQLAGGGSSGPLFVELRPLDRSTPGDRADVHFDGRFEFRRIQSGTYQINVTTPHGAILRSDLVTVGDHNRSISLKLPGPPPPPRGRVSMHRLMHKPPKPARKEFERAADALKRDRPEQAIRHLAKAVALDPEYAEAHNNLAVRYFLNDDLAAAQRHFDRALEIDPELAEVHANLGLMALRTGDAAAAERHVRRALAIGTDTLKADYLLGLALARQHRAAEAMPLLERAAGRFPHAARVLQELREALIRR